MLNSAAARNMALKNDIEITLNFWRYLQLVWKHGDHSFDSRFNDIKNKMDQLKNVNIQNENEQEVAALFESVIKGLASMYVLRRADNKVQIPVAFVAVNCCNRNYLGPHGYFKLNLTVARLLLKVGDIDINAQDSWGETLLMRSAYVSYPGQKEWIELLLSHPRIDINLHAHGQDALSAAINGKQYEVLERLLMDTRIHADRITQALSRAVDNKDQGSIDLIHVKQFYDVAKDQMRLGTSCRCHVILSGLIAENLTPKQVCRYVLKLVDIEPRVDKKIFLLEQAIEKDVYGPNTGKPSNALSELMHHKQSAVTHFFANRNAETEAVLAIKEKIESLQVEQSILNINSDKKIRMKDF